MSCAQENPDATNTYTELAYSKNLVILADHPDVLMGSISGLSVDEQGHIYIADDQLQQIHKFSSDGDFLTSYGREGKGPGEFENLNPRIKTQSGRLYVLQNRIREVDVFDTKSDKHVTTISLENIKVDNKSIGTPHDLFTADNGNLIISFVDPYYFRPEDEEEQKFITLAEIDLSGNFINKNLLQFPTPFPTDNRLVYMEDGSIFVYRVDIYPELLVRSNNDRLIAVKSDSLKFTEYGQDGMVIDQINESHTPIPFSNADLDTLSNRQGDKLKAAVNNAGKPDHWPAFSEFTVDQDGRYWIKQHDPWSDTQPWLIIDRSGDTKWTVNLPSDIKLYPGVGGNAYAIHESPDGLASVYRYIFEF